MVIAFNKQFKDAILSGEKKHTIREDKHNRWKPGMKMHMATGVRTKEYNQFFEAVCLSTQEIEIRITRVSHGIDYLEVEVDGKTLKHIETWDLSLNDGLKNVMGFYEYFNNCCKGEIARSFKGKIIHWTELKY